MKAPAFQFYAGDYLADAQVMMMTLEQEGAYIRLLAICWREGNLPADLKSLSMLCKGASPAVLRVVTKCFQPNPNQAGTLIHKRLTAEIEKQAEWRAKSAAGGKKSAEKRWGDKGGDKGGTNQTVTLLSSSANTTDVVTPATTTPPLKAKSKAEIVAGQVASDGGDTFTADTFKALNDAQTFADSLAYLGYTGIDTERYRLDIRGKVKAAGMDAPAGAFGKFIVSYMTREAAAGPLLKPGGPLLLPSQIASNAGLPFVPMGIPNKEDYLKPRPAGQYMGGIG